MIKDRFNRIIDYLRISVTDRCNLRCLYCMPVEGVKTEPNRSILTLEEITRFVRICARIGIKKIRITGGEPLLRKNLTYLIDEINHIDGIEDISMTTNGILLKRYASVLRRAGLKRINISLDTLDAKKYNYITRGGNINDVFDGIQEACRVGFSPVKINVLLIKDFNEDEIEDFINLTNYSNLHIRFLELMPFGTNANWSKEHFFPANTIMDKFNEMSHIDKVNTNGNCLTNVFRLKYSEGSFGVIAPISEMFCKNCNKIRLTANGYLKPCLHSNKMIFLRNILRYEPNDWKIMHLIEKAIMFKPKKHNLNLEKSHLTNYSIYSMSQIGG